ncbi:hypothetical protein H5410_020781 [Solanum commersonii]|uniref:Uncharacterized protein n=1 Tax=Solanum commersonii TaxID=4109 RepID=A0A9J5ZDB0_SOLCO|nr:hypothetical protein H5410_020781 [Solanum commersonii]
MAGLQYYFFPTDFYYPRPQKISTDDVAVTEAAVRGGVLENPASSTAVDRRNMSQDKILKVSTPLSMNLVRYQPVLVSKNEETNWRRTTNY